MSCTTCLTTIIPFLFFHLILLLFLDENEVKVTIILTNVNHAKITYNSKKDKWLDNNPSKLASIVEESIQAISLRDYLRKTSIPGGGGLLAIISKFVITSNEVNFQRRPRRREGKVFQRGERKFHAPRIAPRGRIIDRFRISRAIKGCTASRTGVLSN